MAVGENALFMKIKFILESVFRVQFHFLFISNSFCLANMKMCIYVVRTTEIDLISLIELIKMGKMFHFDPKLFVKGIFP